MKTKILIFLTILVISIPVIAQVDETCIPQYPDSIAIVNLPWYGNNQFLNNFLSGNGYYDGNPQTRTTSCPEKFLFPVNIWIYRDDAGSSSSSITNLQAMEIVRRLNDYYAMSGTRIRFFIKSLQFQSAESYRTELSSPLQAALMFAAKGLTYGNDEFNIHIIKSYAESTITTGFATLPMYPNIPGATNSCWVKTNSSPTGSYRGDDEIAGTLAHELGHTLGLLHTHHPGRLQSLIFNNNNATISNGCYQESVSRVRSNYWYDGCLSTDNKLKSEVNGDFLSDTWADPNVGKGGTVSAAYNGCVYTWSNGNTDYQVDNWGDVWTPPTRNIMSYSRTDCRKEFSISQIGVQWYYANTFKQSYPNAIPAIAGSTPVPCVGTNFSAPSTFINVTSYSWSVGSNLQILSGQTSPIASIRGITSGSGKIYLDIATPYGSFCLEKTVNVDASTPSPPTFINIDNTSCPEYYFDTNYIPTANSYTWQYNVLPSGPITTFNTTNPQTGRRVLTSGKSYRIGVTANNTCGSSPFFTTTFTVNCGVSKLVSVYPNPSTSVINVVLSEGFSSEKNITLTNSFSETVFNITTKKDSLGISTTQLLGGIYYLKVTDKNGTFQERIYIDK